MASQIGPRRAVPFNKKDYRAVALTMITVESFYFDSVRNCFNGPAFLDFKGIICFARLFAAFCILR